MNINENLKHEVIKMLKKTKKKTIKITIDTFWPAISSSDPI